MSDTSGTDAASPAPDVQQSFSEAAPDVAPEASAPEPAVDPSSADQAPSLTAAFDQSASLSAEPPDLSVTATARAEIDIIDQAEAALAQHDDRWRQLSDRLSNRPAAAPSLDMEGSTQRSVTREYTEYRKEWNAHRDAIEYGAIRDIIDIRASGTTLTNEFSNASRTADAAPEVVPEPTDPIPSQDVESPFQREFSVTASDLSYTPDR